MTEKIKLNFVKSLHSLIWIFYNVVIFYFGYAVIADKIDKWVWICLGLIIVECFVLLIFKRVCPITKIARKYSSSTRSNFDIFLPEWLARNNQLIYSIIVVLFLFVLIYRLLS